MTNQTAPIPLMPEDLEHLLGRFDLQEALMGRQTIETADHPRIMKHLGRKRLRMLGIKGLRALFVPRAICSAVGEDQVTAASLSKQIEVLEREKRDLAGEVEALEGEVKRLRGEAEGR